ncbi:MAG: hypothetical protein HY736_25950 [Verrucomicrobia bacterium]|nr:hypothetical protein [Verrucomicrobiota bacterium]
MTTTAKKPPRLRRTAHGAFVVLCGLMMGFVASPPVRAMTPSANPPKQERGAKKPFDISAGDAFTAVKRFFAQAGEQLIYKADHLAGVKTNAVQSDFTPREALGRMFFRTALSVRQDEKTGALAILPTANANPRNGNLSASAPAADLQSSTKTIAPRP